MKIIIRNASYTCIGDITVGLGNYVLSESCIHHPFRPLVKGNNLTPLVKGNNSVALILILIAIL